jgi:predicted lipoprotein with Yx(FWY)xxD motif
MRFVFSLNPTWPGRIVISNAISRSSRFASGGRAWQHCYLDAMHARVVALAAVVLGLLVCSSRDHSVAIARGIRPLPHHATMDTVIRITYNSGYGRIVLSPDSHSVYMFCTPSTHKCPGRSAHAWPPLIAHGRVVAAPHSKINASKLGTVKLRGGQRQVTYWGHRLYLYRGDHKAGQINGEGIYQHHGQWWLISARGGVIALSTTY